MDAAIACRTCLALNAADNMSVDCDSYDDAAVNGSCP
jgi:hypothetical protein